MKKRTCIITINHNIKTVSKHNISIPSLYPPSVLLADDVVAKLSIEEVVNWSGETLPVEVPFTKIPFIRTPLTEFEVTLVGLDPEVEVILKSLRAVASIFPVLVNVKV